jgi:hypothetical protein
MNIQYGLTYAWRKYRSWLKDGSVFLRIAIQATALRSCVGLCCINFVGRSSSVTRFASGSDNEDVEQLVYEADHARNLLSSSGTRIEGGASK